MWHCCLPASFLDTGGNRCPFRTSVLGNMIAHLNCYHLILEHRLEVDLVCTMGGTVIAKKLTQDQEQTT